jgi:hypothetical protein
VAALERPLEVEVARDRADAADETAGAAALRRAGAAERRQQPPGEPPGVAAQLGIGGDGEIGEQRDRGIAVAGQLGGQRSLVQRADGGGDGGERLVGGCELVPGERAPCALGDPAARLRVAQRSAGTLRAVPAGGGSAAPSVSGAALGLSVAGSEGAASACSSSSAITSSAVRSWSSWTRIRPDSAATAASRSPS